MFEIPILLIVFNRPHHTKNVFEKIRQIKPRKLFVAADGPRENNIEDPINCKKSREIVLQSIDWDCEVKTLFRDKNLGCGAGVSDAISWFFRYVEEGIILEDDCVPCTTFFSFCRELLNTYRTDLRVMQISGANFFPKKEQAYSYFFSKYGLIWGWATWRRAWEKYDFNIELLPELEKTQQIHLYYRSQSELETRRKQFWMVYSKEMDTWDYQWSLVKLANHGLSIIPSTNLISNIGFGENSTHTKINNGLQDMKIESMEFPLKHPPYMLRDFEFECGIEAQAMKVETVKTRLYHLVFGLSKLLKKLQS